ncbi:MAG: DUF1501 domain-containing protein [Pirellulales bacterium]
MHKLSRRSLLQATTSGFGYLALAGLCGQQSQADAQSTPNLSVKPAHLPAKAKSVIFMCMSGGPAQLDTFDYKPQTGDKKHAGSVFKFNQHGESGRWISELFPETAKHADKLCVLNGMYADVTNHAQSFLQLHTGERLRPRPSLGSWVTYGLGSENQNLPGFISLYPERASVYSSALLPPIYEGTPIGLNGENMSKATIKNIGGNHLSMDIKRIQADLIQSMNRDHLQGREEDARLEAVIESLELGFRMQSSAPDLLDTSTESQETLDKYRVGVNINKGRCKPSDFGRQCLLARRFVEAGVRFVEINHGGWDQHKNHRVDLSANCEATDAPIAALLEDLDQRGLLEETLIVWGGEFGRPGLVPDDGKDESGHNARGFTFWMAGGGIKPGIAYGKTDKTGARAVEGKVHFKDLHATILHQLGLDHKKLSCKQGEREFRLTGIEGGKVVKDIIA